MTKEKINKTNACRLLDQKKVAYELIPYEVEENHLGAHHIADQLDEDIDQVFKTLVLKGDKTGHFVCVIPGNEEVNLKKTAIAAVDGLHPWRLLARGHEEALPHLHSRNLRVVRLHLCQRGCARAAVQTKPAGSDCHGGHDRGGPDIDHTIHLTILYPPFLTYHRHTAKQ